MLSSTLLAILLLAAPQVQATLPRRPQPRTYDTHAYYTLELAPSLTFDNAAEVAQRLGVEVVEPLGELEGHWIVRTAGTTHSHELYTRSLLQQADPVVKRWKELRQDTKRSLGDSKHLRSLTPHTLKQRSKRAPHPLASPDRLFPRDDTEFLFAQTEIGLMDPMLNQQWHLINREVTDMELNVTGLWSQGITGKGVHVGIIDDGLDMESDDLAENFVSHHFREDLSNVSTQKVPTTLTTILISPNHDSRTINTVPDVLVKSRLYPTTSVESESHTMPKSPVSESYPPRSQMQTKQQLSTTPIN
jgi:subtilisin family serine protease